MALLTERQASGIYLDKRRDNVVAGSIYPSPTNTEKLGDATRVWSEIHATTIYGDVQAGTISGAEWEHSGDMVIDPNVATATSTLYVRNEAASGVADINIEQDVYVGRWIRHESSGGSIQIYGGDADGSRILLFGTTHATFPGELYYDAAVHTFRDEPGTGTPILILDYAGDITLSSQQDIILEPAGSRFIRLKNTGDSLILNFAADKRVVISGGNSTGSHGRIFLHGNAYGTPSRVSIHSGANEIVRMDEAQVVWNELGADVDMRVEGDNVTDLLSINAGDDTVAINTGASSAYKFYVWNDGTYKKNTALRINHSFPNTPSSGYNALNIVADSENLLLTANNYQVAQWLSYEWDSGTTPDVATYVLTAAAHWVRHNIDTDLSGSAGGQYRIYGYYLENYYQDQAANTGADVNVYGFWSNPTAYADALATIAIDDAYAFYAGSGSSTLGHVSRSFGLGVATLYGTDNNYGIYINPQNQGTNNFAIVTLAGNIVFNESGDPNTDFRVEGDADENLIFTDASTDRVGIGINSPDGKLHVYDGNAGIGPWSSATALIVEAAADEGISILGPDTAGMRMRWGYPTNNNYHGFDAFGPTHGSLAATFGIVVAGSRRANWDATELEFQQAQIISSSTGNITLGPAGELIHDPVGDAVRPETNWDVDLGSITKKYRTLWVGEIRADALVAEDIISTIGGRIWVTNTTKLIAAVTTGATTIDVEHNQMRTGDRVILMDRDSTTQLPKVEWMAITSEPSSITGGFRYNVTRNLDGTGANEWDEGDAVANTGIAGAGWIELYATHSSLGQQFEKVIVDDDGVFGPNLWDSNNFSIFPSTPVLNDAIYIGIENTTWENVYFNIGTAGVYSATIDYQYYDGSWTSFTPDTTPDFTSTGFQALEFQASNLTGWTQLSVDSTTAYWIRIIITAITSWTTSPVQAGKRLYSNKAQYGPTIVGWHRNSATFNDYEEAWAIGNLDGLYGEGNDVVGVGLGRKSQEHIVIDETNGIRIFQDTTTVLASWTGSTITLGKDTEDQLVMSDSDIRFLAPNDDIVGSWAGSTITVGRTTTNGDTWVNINTADGLRLRTRLSGTPTTLFQVDTNGDIIAGEVATDSPNLFWDNDVGRLNFRGGTSGTVVHAYVDSSGEIVAGAGDVTINNTGIEIEWSSGSINSVNAYKFVDSSDNVLGGMFSYSTTGTRNLSFETISNSGDDESIWISALAQNPDVGYIEISTSGLGGTSQFYITQGNHYFNLGDIYLGAPQLIFTPSSSFSTEVMTIDGSRGASTGEHTGTIDMPQTSGDSGYFNSFNIYTRDAGGSAVELRYHQLSDGDGTNAFRWHVGSDLKMTLTESGQFILDKYAASGYLFQIRDTNHVSHGRTAWNTAAVFNVAAISDTDGGAAVQGIAEAAASVGMYLDGISGTANTSKDSTALARVVVRGYDHGGSGTITSLEADANIFAIRNATSTRWILDEDGDTWRDGTTNTFDDHDDLSLVRAFDHARAGANLIKSEWDNFVTHRKDDLVKLGIMAESGWYSPTRLQLLHNGAIWQLATRLMQLEEENKRLTDTLKSHGLLPA